MTFGKRLRNARTAKNMTQKQLASLISAKHNSISNWENDLNKPDPDTIELICGILDITPNYLLAAEPGDFSPVEKLLVKRYRELDDFGRESVDMVIDRELDRTTQAKGAADTIEHLQKRLSIRPIPPHFFAYYGRIAAAGTSVEFSDIAAGVRAYPENEINKKADYVIGVSGDSMEPEYYNGDIVYVQKTDHIETGDIGIFQKGNNIYIKKAGENGLISLNPNYPPLTADDDRIIVLGKVLGKAEEN